MTLPIPASNPPMTNVLVELKDGSQVPSSVLEATTFSIKLLAQNNPFLFHDLVSKCRNPDIQLPPVMPFSSTTPEAMLKKLALMNSNGRINDMVEKIVLNSVDGEGMGLHFVDPLKKV
jgi:hypothetical protein